MAKSPPYKEIVEDRVAPQARSTHWIFGITPLWAWGSMPQRGRQRSALQVAASMSNFHKYFPQGKENRSRSSSPEHPSRTLAGLLSEECAKTLHLKKKHQHNTGNDSDNTTELEDDDSDMDLWFLLVFNLVIHLQTTVSTHSNLSTYLIPDIHYLHLDSVTHYCL